MDQTKAIEQPYVPPHKRNVKLQYIQEYRVILCVQCGYCVLQRALDRHLKAIHHLPASERKKHLRQVENLDVADLEDVAYPSPGSEPIPGLPVFDGFACDADECSYLCVTNKRMQAHWRNDHAGLTDLHCHRVELQTFFRGNSLKYFVVARRSSARRRIAENRQAENVQRLLTSSKGDRGIIPANCTIETIVKLPRTNEKRAEVFLTNVVPPPNDGVESAIEWLLTRQFCAESYTSLQPVKGSSTSWRDEVFQACTETDFLRFAILSLSAYHIAFEHSEAREFYEKEADKYRDKAIAALTNRISEVTTDNFFEVFNFTRLITLCCLAGIQLNKLDGGEQLAAQSVLPEWFPVQRHGKELIWPLRGDGRIIRAMHGPWESLVTSNMMPTFDLENNPYNDKLYELELALVTLPDHLVDRTCLTALHILRRVWATPYRDDGNGFRDMALMWATRIPFEYLQLVESNDPVALIVLAHYWVLWSMSEDFYWYMKGHAETMLLRIVSKLDYRWQDWIEWPISKVFGGDLVDESA